MTIDWQTVGSREHRNNITTGSGVPGRSKRVSDCKSHLKEIIIYFNTVYSTNSCSRYINERLTAAYTCIK